jgi:hypothetical protein
MAKQADKKNGVGGVVGVVAGVAALSAAAYVLFGPNAKKNRTVIRGWAVKMKGEIIEKFEEAQELTEPTYHKIIDKVSEKYAKIKNIDQAELKATIAEIRKHWKAMTKGSQKRKKK